MPDRFRAGRRVRLVFRLSSPAATSPSASAHGQARASPEVLSLYGEAHLVLAVAAARDNERSQAHEHIDTARKIAEQLGEDRDDYGTEFGPTNVAIHAVNIAVELGAAGGAAGALRRRALR